MQETQCLRELALFAGCGGGVSSAARCSAGGLSRQSRSNPTALTPSGTVRTTDSSTASRSTPMCEPSTVAPGAERSTSSAADSRVRTSASPDTASASSAANGAACGASTPESFARFDPATCSWKTHQGSRDSASESSSPTWPRAGMMLRGRCYRLPNAERRISATECGSSPAWPTPCASDHRGPGVNGACRDRLDYAVERGMTKHRVYPTPRTRGLCGGSGSYEMLERMVQDGTMTPEEKRGVGNGGRLNPEFVEWLMGWPIGWTASRPLETGKFRLWLRGRSWN